MKTKKEKGSDLSTEERIKAAARIVFTQKGYAATRTRDIADQAGINLALLNYYFRSKEKLFHIVMLEKVQQIFGILGPILNDESLPLETKIEYIVARYIDLISQNPDLPIFVLTEVRNNIDQYSNRLQIQSIIMQSHFVKQLKERKPHVSVYHFIINLLALTIFPFVAKPIFQAATQLSNAELEKLIEERKILIPKWINILLDNE